MDCDEIRRFLADFLKSHDIDENGIDIVYSNIDTAGSGMINKYKMAVFFLKIAQYEDLIIKKDIQMYTGFPATLME